MSKTVVWAMLLFCLACSGQSDLSGRYRAKYEGLSRPVEVVMILGDDGSGKWEIGGEVLPFLWSVRGGGLNVHTREGAVVEGVVDGANVRLDVPGVGKLVFTRGT